jgi:hypothetical protein
MSCSSGKRRRDTVLVCLSSVDVDEGRIQLNKVARNNLRVKLGDLVHIHQCLDIKYGKRVHILPFDDSIKGLSGDIFDVYLKPYFTECNFSDDQKANSESSLARNSLSSCAQGQYLPSSGAHPNRRI